MNTRRAAKTPYAPPPDRTPESSRPQAEGGFALGPNDLLVGRLHIEGDLRVGGTVEGEVQATGDVEIDDQARVKASLAGRKVSIRGHVTGPVNASERLVVARSGSVIGDVRVARLVVQDGATINGNVSMGPAETVPRPPEVAPPATKEKAGGAEDVQAKTATGKRRAGAK